MTNRLPYETLAGNLSAKDTFKQLIENIQLAEEDLRKLANIAALRADIGRSKQWTHMANNFNQVRDIITILAKGKSKPMVQGGGVIYNVEPGNG